MFCEFPPLNKQREGKSEALSYIRKKQIFFIFFCSEPKRIFAKNEQISFLLPNTGYLFVMTISFDVLNEPMISDSNRIDLMSTHKSDSHSDEISTLPRLHSNVIRVAMEGNDPNIDTLPLNSTIKEPFTLIPVLYNFSSNFKQFVFQPLECLVYHCFWFLKVNSISLLKVLNELMISDSNQAVLTLIPANDSDSDEIPTLPRLNSNAIRVATEENDLNIDTIPLRSTVKQTFPLILYKLFSDFVFFLNH